MPPPIVEVESNDTVDLAQYISVPSVIEGAIGQAGDIDTFKFAVKPGQRLAFEIETPKTRYPYFDPRLTVLDSRRNELLTNIQKRISTRGQKSTSYLKSVDAKVIDTFLQGGACFLQNRDITNRYGNPSFMYRVLIREQIPHIGEIEVKNGDHVNLIRGEARKLAVITGLEEGFAGESAIRVEGLPEGVSTLPGTEVPVTMDSRDKYEETYKEESYLPKTSQVTIVFWADADAPITTKPQIVRLSAYPIVQGKLGQILPIWEFPMMVIEGLTESTAKEGRN